SPPSAFTHSAAISLAALPLRPCMRIAPYRAPCCPPKSRALFCELPLKITAISPPHKPGPISSSLTLRYFRGRSLGYAAATADCQQRKPEKLPSPTRQA